MRNMRRRGVVFFTLLIVLTLPVVLQAQTATSASVSGTVTDATGAVIPGATVEFVNLAVNTTVTRETNAAGQYTFPSMAPGTYNLTVTMQGFRVTTINDVAISVAKSYNYNFVLEVGAVTDTVEVFSEATVELQTVDASIGNVIGKDRISRMPTLSRTANELLTLQPGATPTGEITGARNDQSTFTLDGLDVTNQSIGGLGTWSPLPVDFIEEFRVTVANSNASSGRGAGGQVAIRTIAGSTAIHGAAWWYHQNDNLNANVWENNRTGVTKAELKDNRGGFRVGGPVWPSDKLFWFVGTETRRFPRATNVNRTIPDSALRSGTLTFNDCDQGFLPVIQPDGSTEFVCQGGSPITYDLATSTGCGLTGLLPCDPRGIGISPVTRATWALLPAGNDSTLGDGLNTIGIRTTVANPRENDFYTGKLDYNISDTWVANSSIRYFSDINFNTGQLDLRGAVPTAPRVRPTRQNFISAGVRGQITSNLTADFTAGLVRIRNGVSPMRPNAAAAAMAIPGTEDGSGGFIAVDFGGRFAVREPIDIDTQVARKQDNDDKTYQYNANFTWVNGDHTMQFGASLKNLHTIHLRDDKVVSGGLGALVTLTGGSVDADLQPPPCNGDIGQGPIVTINCLNASDLGTWDNLYTATLGFADNTNVFMVRDGNFNPLPFGTQLTSDTKMWANEFYIQDIWRVSSTFTVTAGLNYGYQLAPTEKLGRQTKVIDADTGATISARSYIESKRAASLAGTTLNVRLGFLPVNDADSTDVFNIDWDNVAPRLSAAWSPSYSDGFMGRLFGEGKTVIRGGYTLSFDRQNTVQSVIIPALGVGFAQAISELGATCDASGTPGLACNAAGNLGLSGFRLGVDGQIPVPVPPPQSNPVVPTDAVAIFPEILSFQVDPDIQVGENHSFNLTWQREVGWNMLLDISYQGRLGRELPQSINFNSTPYFHVDNASGQSFAEAFDAVAAILRAGGTVIAADAQPWFENQLPLTTCTGAGFATCTEFIAATNSSNFINANVSNLFGAAFAGRTNAIDVLRFNANMPTFNNFLADALFMRTSSGESNYHGLLVTLRKRMSDGLQFDVNYTFSRSLDQSGAIQNSAGLVPNSFNLNSEYGPSEFDITHLFNVSYLYELPFSAGNSMLNKLVNGWFTSGIFRRASGLPRLVSHGSQVWGGAGVLGNGLGAIPTVDLGQFGNSVHSGVIGSNGVGTNGDPANNGSGLNLFADPEAVHAAFRFINLATDGRTGRGNPLRGFNRSTFDVTLGKRTTIGERASISFEAQFFNLFNHPIFNDPALNLFGGNVANFGVVTEQFTPPNRVDGARAIQFGLRVEF